MMTDYSGVVRRCTAGIAWQQLMPLPFALQWGLPIVHDSVHAQVRALPPLPISEYEIRGAPNE